MSDRAPGDTPPDPDDVAAARHRVAAVRHAIDEMATAAGRDPGRVRLVAIGKTHPWSALRAMAAAGVADLGENRVAELVAKMDHPDPAGDLAGIHWHFVGRLQSRKARDVVGRDVLVHSVDRRSLVDALQRRAARAEVAQRLLVQVNVGDDPAKGGCDVHEVDGLVAYACGQPNLVVQGLMTMPPLAPDGADPDEAARPHFARLRRLRDRLAADWPTVVELSMGMSADMAAAVAEGATMVRIGTALFGPRRAGPWLGDRPEGV